VSPDFHEVQFFLPLGNFERHVAPATTEEYVEYREKVLDFIAARSSRMAGWVMEHHPDIEVRQ
jgi:glucuronate isomerase